MDAQQSTAAVRDIQSDHDDGLTIHLEPIAAVHPESDGTYLLSRVAKFRLSLAQPFAAPGAEVSLTFSALNNELYSSYPLHLYIHVNGFCTEIVALEKEFDRATVRFRVKRPGIVHVGVELRNRVLPSGNRDLRLPAFRLLKVSAKRLAKTAALFTAPYVDDRGQDSQYAQARFFSTDTPSADPIFIIGAPRSGTSILTWAIGAHPNIYPIDETNFFPLLALSALANYRQVCNEPNSFVNRFDVGQNAFMQAHGAMMHDLIIKAADAQHRHNAHTHLAGVSYSGGVAFTLSRTAEDSKRRWVDGAPINTIASYVISMMFPAAKFIHLIRHPASVIASLLQFEKAGGIALTFEAAIDEWNHQVHYGRLLESALGPTRVLMLRIEDFTEAADEQMRKIFRFLGEPHYEAAKDRFLTRINSSNIELEFAQEVRSRFDASDRRSQLLALYEGPVRRSQSAAIAELVNTLNDVGVKLLKTVFGHQFDSIF